MSNASSPALLQHPLNLSDPDPISELLLGALAAGTLVAGSLWAGADVAASRRVPTTAGSADPAPGLPSAQVMTAGVAALMFLAASVGLLLLYLLVNFVGYIMVRYSSPKS